MKQKTRQAGPAPTAAAAPGGLPGRLAWLMMMVQARCRQRSGYRAAELELKRLLHARQKSLRKTFPIGAGMWPASRNTQKRIICVRAPTFGSAITKHAKPASGATTSRG